MENFNYWLWEFQFFEFFISLVGVESRNWIVRDLRVIFWRKSKVCCNHKNFFDSQNTCIGDLQKKFGRPRFGASHQYRALLFSIFPFLKVGLGAMFEVFPWASWRSNNGSKAFPKSSHTHILKIWSWNQNFPPGSLEDSYVPEKNFASFFK